MVCTTRRVAALLATVVLLGSCGSGSDDSAGDSSDATGGSGDAVPEATIDAGGVAEQVNANLAEMGLTPDAVVCPDDLVASVGRTTRCEITLGGTSWGVTVEVASTSGGSATLDVTVDDQPG